MQTLSLYDNSLIWAGLFRNKSVNKSRILQEFFPTSSLLSFPKRVSLESCFLIRHPDLGNKVRNSFQRHFLPVCVLSPSSSGFLWDLWGIFSSYSLEKEHLGLYQFRPSLCEVPSQGGCASQQLCLVWDRRYPVPISFGSWRCHRNRGTVKIILLQNPLPAPFVCLALLYSWVRSFCAQLGRIVLRVEF